MYFDIMDDPDYSEESISFDITPQKVNIKTVKNPSVVTCSGSVDSLKNLQEPFVRDLAAEPFYWKRLYAKWPVKEIYCNIEFVKYSEWQLTVSPDPSSVLLGPILHTFWCDCQNLDLYRSTIKDQLTAWTTFLETSQQEWIIIVLVRPELRKGPRTKPAPRLDVFEKVKADFCGKAKDRERCLFLWDPKSGMGDSESWRNCILRFRQFVFDAYESRLKTFDDQVRNARENRKKPEWKLSEYFTLRETLAIAYQRLNFAEEALLHLDELDSLVGLFVAEVSDEGEVSGHLAECTRAPCDWLGIQLGKDTKIISSRIASGKGSLLDIRSCLFLRQSELLLELNRPNEISSRALPFIQNVNQDHKLFKACQIPGAMDCWIFLVCHEVRQTALSSGDGVPQIGEQNSATLQGIEREKLSVIGRLCGLFPGEKVTEHQQQLVSILTKAIEAPYPSSAILKLYDALLSQEKFNKNFLEMSEMTMGTFKHIGRMRAARLIGVDIASYYMKLGRFEKAGSFLLDAIKVFRTESWDFASADIASLYCKCAVELKQWDQVLKSALLVTSCQFLSIDQRIHHQKLFTRILHEESSTISPVAGSGSAVVFVDVKPGEDYPMVFIDQECSFKVKIDSHFPEPLAVEEIILCIVPVEGSSRIQARRMTSLPSWDLDSITTVDSPLVGDKVISCASTLPVSDTVDGGRSFPSVKFTQPKRSRSGVKSPDQFDWKDIPGNAVMVSTLVTEITPGLNQLVFNLQIDQAGDYRIHQLRVQCTKSFALSIPVPIGPSPHLRIFAETPACSIEPDHPTDRRFTHCVYSFRLLLSGDAVSKLGDQVFSLTTSHTDLELLDLQKLPLTKDNVIACSSVTTFRFFVICKSSAETFTGEILAKFPWTKQAHSFSFSFSSPVSLTTKSYCCPPFTFIAVEIANRIPETIEVSDVKLDVADEKSTDTLVFLTKVLRTFKMTSLDVVRLIWKSEKEFSGLDPLCFCMQYVLGDAEGSRQALLEKTFNPGIFGSMQTRISLTSPADRNFIVGDPIHLSYQIVSRDIPGDMPPVYYQVKFDNNVWTCADEISGSLELHDIASFTLQLTVIPNKPGETLLPIVRLFYLKDDDIILMEPFHIYNETLLLHAKIKNGPGRVLSVDHESLRVDQVVGEVL